MYAMKCTLVPLTGGDSSNKRCLSSTMCKWQSSQESGISSRIFNGRNFPKNSKIPEILTSLLSVSQKIFKVSRFPAKSWDSWKKCCFSPKTDPLSVDTPPPLDIHVIHINKIGNPLNAKDVYIYVLKYEPQILMTYIYTSSVKRCFCFCGRSRSWVSFKNPLTKEFYIVAQHNTQKALFIFWQIQYGGKLMSDFSEVLVQISQIQTRIWMTKVKETFWNTMEVVQAQWMTMKVKKKSQKGLTSVSSSEQQRVIFHWLSETKEVENVFLTHRWSLGIGHVTVGRAVVFVASAIIDLPTRPPRDFQFFMCHILNVQTL